MVTKTQTQHKHTQGNTVLCSWLRSTTAHTTLYRAGVQYLSSSTSAAMRVAQLLLALCTAWSPLAPAVCCSPGGGDKESYVNTYHNKTIDTLIRYVSCYKAQRQTVLADVTSTCGHWCVVHTSSQQRNPPPLFHDA